MEEETIMVVLIISVSNLNRCYEFGKLEYLLV